MPLTSTTYFKSMDNRALNSQPSYMFQSSKAACKVALEMHYDKSSKNPLQQQVAFLDGLHSCVKNYDNDIVGVQSSYTCTV